MDEENTKAKTRWNQWLYLGAWLIIAVLVVFQIGAHAEKIPEWVERPLNQQEQEEIIARNSPLVDYVYLTGRADFPRQEEVERITIHSLGSDLSLEEAGELYSLGDRLVSANYAIDSEGNIGLYVEEENASHTSGSRSNDNRSVNIEVANDRSGGHVTQQAFASLVNLVTDICYRNNIEELVFTGDDQGSLTLHSMFRNTTCPGEYLRKRIPELTANVNEQLIEKRTEAALLAEIDAKMAGAWK